MHNRLRCIKTVTRMCCGAKTRRNGCTLKRWPPYFPLESALDRILEIYLFRNSIAQIKDIGIWTTSECLVLYHSLLEMQKLLQEKLTFRRAHIDLPQTITNETTIGVSNLPRALWFASIVVIYPHKCHLLREGYLELSLCVSLFNFTEVWLTHNTV